MHRDCYLFATVAVLGVIASIAAQMPRKPISPVCAAHNEAIRLALHATFNMAMRFNSGTETGENPKVIPGQHLIEPSDLPSEVGADHFDSSAAQGLSAQALPRLASSSAREVKAR